MIQWVTYMVLYDIWVEFVTVAYVFISWFELGKSTNLLSICKLIILAIYQNKKGSYEQDLNPRPLDDSFSVLSIQLLLYLD